MKKRTNITLSTKIYLTIAGLLALTGIIYASNPFPFSSGNPLYASGTWFPTGVAASTDQLLVTPFCSDEIDLVDCNGNATVFANIPGFGSCREKYMTFAPSQSVAAGFSPRDVFVTQGAMVYKVHNGVTTLFASIGGCLSS